MTSITSALIVETSLVTQEELVTVVMGQMVGVISTLVEESAATHHALHPLVQSQPHLLPQHVAPHLEALCQPSTIQVTHA